MALNKLWVEAYRPKTVSDVVFANPEERTFFDNVVKSKSLPNLLLVGAPGTGKTSLSGALLNDLGVLPEDVLRVNCSDEKIDAMRDKVKTFAYTMAMGDFKVVQLEEMDNLSNDAQKLLRSLLEEVSGSCRFIGTGNYQNRIIPAMQDRFQVFNFSKPDRDDIALRAAWVLEVEKIEFEAEDLLKVVEAGYPSVRRVLSLLEKSSKTGKLVVIGEGAVADWKLQLLPLLEASDLKGARTLVCASASKDELQDVYRYLYDNLHRSKKLNTVADEAVVLIADYQRYHEAVDDKEIHIAALFIELGAL
jgi:DNA polymerase III delta prime subunit